MEKKTRQQEPLLELGGRKIKKPKRPQTQQASGEKTSIPEHAQGEREPRPPRNRSTQGRKRPSPAQAQGKGRLKPPHESSKQEQPRSLQKQRGGEAEQASRGREQGKEEDPKQPCKHGITGWVKGGAKQITLTGYLFGRNA